MCLCALKMLYADDIIVLVCDKDPNVVSRELDSCDNWLIARKFSLRFGKTEYKLFNSKRNFCLVKNGHVTCNNHYIKGTKCVKYHGVILDQDLSGRSMIA